MNDFCGKLTEPTESAGEKPTIADQSTGQSHMREKSGKARYGEPPDREAKVPGRVPDRGKPAKRLASDKGQ